MATNSVLFFRKFYFIMTMVIVVLDKDHKDALMLHGQSIRKPE